MLPVKAMSFLIGVSFLLGLSLGFVPVRPISRKQGLALETSKIPTALFVQSKEEQDWLAEMDSKSYDYLREHKEPLFDHDDWAEYRSPNRRLDDTFDFMFPMIAAFVIYFLWAAIQM